MDRRQARCMTPDTIRRLACLALACAALSAPLTAAESAEGTPLPIAGSIDDVAWTPLSGGRLALTTDGGSNLQILDSAGKTAGQIFVPLTKIRDVRSMPDGSFVYADTRTGKLYRVAADSSLTSSAGSRGFSEGEFLQLERAEGDARGRLLGLDAAELKVHQFSAKGELLATFAVESGPALDLEGRVIGIQDRVSAGLRRVVAYETPEKMKLIYQGKLETDTRWEAVTGLSDGTVLMRIFDAAGRCSLQRVGARGREGDAIALPEDALLAGPSRVVAVDPERTHVVYLAGTPGSYRAVRVPIPK